MLDTHKLDGVFALFAPDVMVPWKHPAIRLDTYSGAPVDFTAYEADPAEVLIAGSMRIRAIDTSTHKAAFRWKFTPPSGYKFESNNVDLPFGNREGFFVVEARRGDASQQTWVNVTRIGLVTKEAPEGSVLYGADLSNGQPLRGMRVIYLSGGKFVYDKTDANGLAHVPGATRFALAEWGSSHAFVPIAPQAPLPGAIVGVRTDRGIVRAGESVRVIGFARKREGKTMRPMSGEVHVNAVVAGRTVATTSLPLGQSGGFSGNLQIPADVPTGDLSILASAEGATGGSTVHVDAAGNLSLTIVAACPGGCRADTAVPLRIVVRSGTAADANEDVAVRVIRSPHIIPSDEPETSPRWGTTTIVERTIRTGNDGVATISLPPSSDGLSSTYGVTASAQNATATARVVTPNASTALAITPEDAEIDVGGQAAFEVRGFSVTDGRPAKGRSVQVTLTKGPDVQDQTVTLDDGGRGRVVFATPQLGTNVATATFADDSSGLDATAITVAPLALGARATRRSSEISIALDKDRYKVGERVTVTASLDGAIGSALFTVEGARVADQRIVNVSGGKASATLALEGVAGSVRVGVAFVKDGAVYVSDTPVAIDGPGYPRMTALSSDRTDYAPGATAHIAIRDGSESGTSLLVIRVSDGRPSGGAAFDDAPAILAAGGTTTQNPAADDKSWHAYVAPAGSKAQDIFGTERTRTAAAREGGLAVSATRAVVWRVDGDIRSSFDVAVPSQRGSYVLSIMKISNDGDVGAASLALSVQ